MKIGKTDINRYILPLMNSNMFLLISGHNALVIDPNRSDEALRKLNEARVDNIMVILTHEHFDHISGVNKLRELVAQNGGKCTVYANTSCAESITDADSNLSRFFRALFITRSEEEQQLAERIFDMDYSCAADVSFEGDTELKWEDITLKLHSTPGHSPGSICIEMYDESGKLLAVATGDSLVEGNTVITRLPRGSKSDYRSITRPYLESLGSDTLILPGHGEISYMRELILG